MCEPYASHIMTVRMCERYATQLMTHMSHQLRAHCEDQSADLRAFAPSLCAHFVIWVYIYIYIYIYKELSTLIFKKKAVP